ncbi:MAG: acyltransferase [Crocinitomicaceae bacterium]|jgi:peptidoglycan/LPS O-acetylase OafA/YrhL|nr:acyltransferase [Crocinitomicaceae bacterium]MDP4761959.1 acyltransferase [Crocinitomicaceae bacterium]
MRKLFQFEISENRIFGLDLLRFIAIFMVLLGHSLILAPEWFDKLINPYLFDGVAIFFVLSGFLIGGILIKILNKEKPSVPVLLDFWKRRWMRTLPVYLFVLLLLLSYTLLFYPRNFPDEWYRFFFFTQNILGHVRPGFFAEAWSLSIEEWFYLTVPLILITLLMVFKSSVKWTIFAVSIAIIALVTYYRYHLYHSWGMVENPNPYQLKLFKKFLSSGIDYQVIPRLDSIMYGVLAAFFAYYYPKLWNAKWNKLLIFVCLFLLYYSKFQMGKSWGPFSNIWCPSLKSLGIFFLLPVLSNWRQGFGNWTKWVTFFSLISYSMYLVNLNVVTIAIIKHSIHGVFNNSLNQELNGYWGVDYALFWLFTISISFVLYQWIEVPFMKLRDKKRA